MIAMMASMPSVCWVLVQRPGLDVRHGSTDLRWHDGPTHEARRIEIDVVQWQEHIRSVLVFRRLLLSFACMTATSVPPQEGSKDRILAERFDPPRLCADVSRVEDRFAPELDQEHDATGTVVGVDEGESNGVPLRGVELGLEGRANRYHPQMVSLISGFAFGTLQPGIRPDALCASERLFDMFAHAHAAPGQLEHQTLGDGGAVHVALGERVEPDQVVRVRVGEQVDQRPAGEAEEVESRVGRVVESVGADDAVELSDWSYSVSGCHLASGFGSQ